MDYFNKEERKHQKKFKDARTSFLKPLLKILTKLKITPNIISIIGIVFLLIGISTKSLIISFIFIFIYCLNDGLDGALARFQNKSHTGGAIVDIVSDQLGVVLIAAASLYHLNPIPFLPVIFSNFYCATIILMVYANSKNIKFPTIVRIKYVFYSFYYMGLIFDFLNQKNIWNDFNDIIIFNSFLSIFSFYYIITTIIMIKKIYKHFDTKHKQDKNVS